MAQSFEQRLKILSSFVSALSEDVEVQHSQEKGFGLYARKACAQGSVLLSVPFSSCIIQDEVEKDTDAQAALRAKFLQLPAEDPRLLYLRAAAPEASFQSHPAAWQSLDASPSLAFQRARRWRNALAEEWQRWSQTKAMPSVEEHLWCALVVQTRALETESQGLLLCPGIDLCNHTSVAPTANVKLQEKEMTLVAAFALDPGDEVTISYYPEADYLDLFEAYGFFDNTCLIHTIEVPGLSLNALLSSCADEGLPRRRRQQHVWRAAKEGYAEDLEAWWVPDFNIEACPLWRAVRARFADHEELKRSESLEEPIRREAEVKVFLRELFQGHLDCYGPLERKVENPHAAQLVDFETKLLRRLLEVCSEKKSRIASELSVTSGGDRSLKR